METEVIPRDEAAKKRTIELLKNGGVAMLPTDYSYGLAVNGLDKRAVARIYELKARDGWKPVPVLATPALAHQYAEAPPKVANILNRVWPGALAVVLPRKDAVPRFVSDRDTVMLFCPDTWSWELAEEAGFPIARTSANLTRELPYASVEDARKGFGDKVDLIVDGGPARIGKPTTIVDLTSGQPEVLREGWFPLEEVKRLFGEYKLGEAP